MTYYEFTRAHLKTKNASDFKDGDIIKCGKYYINIKYGKYKRPSLCSFVEDRPYHPIDCTAGVKGGTPYYIDDFLGR